MPSLFSPLSLKGLTLPNRIVIPPMDQYSATDGLPSAWHSMHYGTLAVSGAGLLIVEATSVTPDGRITHNDLGLWNDAQQHAHAIMLDGIRQFSTMPIAVQLAHAGRKASTACPWEGKGALCTDDDGWQICAPSALAYDTAYPIPAALSIQNIADLVTAFVQAAVRAHKAGYDLIELHAAHGYLMHQFLSPLANTRTDSYGGSLENRMRFPLEVLSAVIAALPASFPIGVRVSGTDFAEGGWNIEECAAFAQELEKHGCSVIHVSGGGLSPQQKISLTPGYQVPLAVRVKAATTMPVIAVGLITEAELASGIITTQQADMVAIGRAMLYDPRWPWHAAAKLGESIKDAPRQYLRCQPHNIKGLLV